MAPRTHLPPGGRVTVSQEGFEPTTRGLRVRCSTVELLAPHTILDVCGRSRDQVAAPILKTFVPQTGHTPSVAGRPFFIVIARGSLISRGALHFTQ